MQIPGSSQDRMIRPRLVYLSSGDTELISNNGKIDLSLSEHISAEDGHNLMYGVRGLGYNSTVRNISERIGNNEIHLRLYYRSDPAGHPDYYNPVTQTWQAKRAATTVELVIKIPSGVYTLDSLFDFLSNGSDGEIINYRIPTGFYADYTLAAQTLPTNRPNEILARLVWIRTPSGFYIEVKFDSTVVTNLTVQDALTADHDIWNVTEYLYGIRIVPTPLVQKKTLYNQLFTNSRSDEIPSCIPDYETRTGLNPPNGIQFTFADLHDAPTFYENIALNITEIGNEALYQTSVGHFPNPNNAFYVQYWESFHMPKINPVYVDVSTSLPVNTMTVEGTSKNLLTRVFALGGSVGNSSYSYYYDNPVIYSLEGYDRITAISLQFTAEDELWDFFDLEFLLEIIFFEVEDEKDVQNFPDPDLEMPDSDPLTTAVTNYSNQSGQHLPLTSSGISRGTLEFKRRRL